MRGSFPPGLTGKRRQPRCAMCSTVRFRSSRLSPRSGYFSSVRWEFGEKRTGGKSPHIRFANANSDEELIEFVSEFGPVVPSAASVHDPPYPEVTTITAVQSLPVLRREQSTYASAVRLMIELKRGSAQSDANAILQHVSKIVEGVMFWPEQYEAECIWRQGQYLPSASWHFDTDSRLPFFRWKREMEFRLEFEKIAIPERDSYSDFDSYLSALSLHMVVRSTQPTVHYVGHNVLCKLINAFRTEVQHLGDYSVEALPFFSLRLGIRPALYVILKHEYLGRFFVRERAGAHFCSPDCSQQYRQRIYWAQIGAKKRKRRTKRHATSRQKTLRD
jgi:hypothetical protein